MPETITTLHISTETISTAATATTSRGMQDIPTINDMRSLIYLNAD